MFYLKLLKPCVALGSNIFHLFTIKFHKCLQVPPMQQPMVGVGSLPPQIFPGSMDPVQWPLPAFNLGMPPFPFMRPGFNPLQMPPGITTYSHYIIKIKV